MTIAASRYRIRPMAVADIDRVSEIERESFPTMWPQTAYKRELQRNNLAAYLVIGELASANASLESELQEKAEERTGGPESQGWKRLTQRLRHWLNPGVSPHREDAPAPAPATERLSGFVGMWFMVDEAHIVTIAVAAAARRRGLGEALLIAAIELAQRRGQQCVTLECRVSNTPAQALYEKYGFRREGLRKRYYTDNNEDALIMTTPPITSSEYQGRFEQLRAAHRARHGAPLLDDLEPV